MKMQNGEITMSCEEFDHVIGKMQDSYNKALSLKVRLDQLVNDIRENHDDGEYDVSSYRHEDYSSAFAEMFSLICYMKRQKRQEEKQNG